MQSGKHLNAIIEKRKNEKGNLTVILNVIKKKWRQFTMSSNRAVI